MPKISVVQKTNAELRELVDLLTRHRENPHMITLAKHLVTLTNVNDAGDIIAEVEAEVKAEVSNVVSIVEDECKKGIHKLTDIYGRCQKCKECTHPPAQVRNGACMTCDKIMDEEKDPNSQTAGT